MADPVDLETGDAGEVSHDPASDPGMPRWVKILLIVSLALVLVFVVAKLTGAGGEHGPGRHGGDHSLSSAVDQKGGRPPLDRAP